MFSLVSSQFFRNFFKIFSDFIQNFLTINVSSKFFENQILLLQNFCVLKILSKFQWHFSLFFPLLFVWNFLKMTFQFSQYLSTASSEIFSKYSSKYFKKFYKIFLTFLQNSIIRKKMQIQKKWKRTSLHPILGRLMFQRGGPVHSKVVYYYYFYYYYYGYTTLILKSLYF